jgi:ABC-type multidrug transport system fused ATPase/permease subunit
LKQLSIKNWFIKETKILNTLEISNNEIDDIENSAFDSLANLQRLDLSNNKLTNESLDRLCNNQSGLSFNLNFLEVHRNLFTSLLSVFLKNFKTQRKARLFNLDVIEIPGNFNNSISLKNMNSFTKEDVNQFIFQKHEVELVDGSFSINTTFNDNSLSSFELKSKYKNLKEGLKFTSIPKTFSVIIGINGTGKTTLLQLIEN